jgi:hypothetical protein
MLSCFFYEACHELLQKKKKKLASIQEGLFVALYAEVQTRAAEGCTTKGIPSEELIGASRSDSSKVGDGIRRS